MAPHRARRRLAAYAAALLLLAARTTAQGEANTLPFTHLVVFGDSISDDASALILSSELVGAQPELARQLTAPGKSPSTPGRPMQRTTTVASASELILLLVACMCGADRAYSGPVWPEYVAQHFELTLRNYATGGATSDSASSCALA